MRRLALHQPARVTVEGRVRVLLGHSGGYEEWGIHGGIRVKTGADGQGLSFSLRPGDSGSGVQALWRDGAAGDANDDDAADDYHARLDASVGYGFALRAHDVMVTPYTEMTLGATDSYRIGLNWKAGSRFDLTVLGERRESEDRQAEHAILLKGEVRF